MCSYWALENTATIYILTFDSPLFPRLQYNLQNSNAPHHHDKTHNRRGSTELKGGSDTRINLNSSSLSKWSFKKPWSFRSRSLSTAMLVWQPKLQSAPESFSSRLSTMSNDNASSCGFYLPSRHQTKYIRAPPPQLLGTLINKRKANLLSMSKRRRRYSSNPYCGPSPPK